MENWTEKSCADFVRQLAAKQPIPGGGGAAALTAALAAALCAMAGQYTVGKKSAALWEEELRSVLAESETLSERFLELMNGDAEAFAPMAEGYALPKDSPERAAKLKEGARCAARVPQELLRLCRRTMELLMLFAERGSASLLSDVCCAAILCRAAAECSVWNVRVNAEALHERAETVRMESEAETLQSDCAARAEAVLRTVEQRFSQKGKSGLV